MKNKNTQNNLYTCIFYKYAVCTLPCWPVVIPIVSSSIFICKRLQFLIKLNLTVQDVVFSPLGVLYWMQGKNKYNKTTMATTTTTSTTTTTTTMIVWRCTTTTWSQPRARGSNCILNKFSSHSRSVRLRTPTKMKRISIFSNRKYLSIEQKNKFF